MINSVGVSGEASSDFSAEIVGMATPASIPAGGSFGVHVAFAPIAYGVRDAMVTIAHRRAGDPGDYAMVVQVTGRVTQPSLSAPTFYDFGAVTIGTSSEITLELGTTVPSDTLHVTNFSKSGAGASRFAVTSTTDLPAGLTGDAKAGFRIVYTPSGATRDSATLVVYTINGGQPTRIKLYGTGAVSAAPQELSLATAGVAVSPNPATARAEVRFVVDATSQVRVQLLDLLGRPVRTVVAGTMSRGEQRVGVAVDDLAAGTYLCRVQLTGADGVVRSHVTQLVRK
jgi:hypothetical protein